jgi:acyl-CoA synthetase (NDP forming)
VSEVAVTLTAQEAIDRLRTVGIPFVEARTVENADHARRVAEQDEGPWVMKAGGLVHKSDAGGVITGLADPEAVAQAVGTLLDRLGPAGLPLLLQRQVAGTEVLVGLRREPRVGAVVIVGMGGIHAEVLDDTAVALVPLDADRARRMVTSLRGASLLLGHRGSPPIDLVALHEVICAMSDLADRFDDVVEADLNPVMVGGEGGGAAVVDVRMSVMAATEGPERSTDLRRALTPEHVAVVGVSDDPDKVGGRIYRNLVRHGFAGNVHAVHPAGGTIDSRPRLASLDALDTAPDLVCVAVPAHRVVEVARAAVRRGAGGLLVHSAGFAETGPDGRRLQDELVAITRAGGVPLLGPNSMGVVAPARRLAASLSGTLGVQSPRAGGISLVSTSGALSSCLASRLWERGGGIASWISVGNEADVDMPAYLAWLADDSETTTVGLIVESLTDGPRFVEAARALRAAGTSLFAFSPGRTARGRAAAMSHTGALVGSHVIRERVLAAGGAVVVEDLVTLENALLQAEAGRLPAGARLGVITGSGGACAIIADAAEPAGIELPPFPDAAAARLASLLPRFAAVANPLDVTAHVLNHPEMFGPVVETAAHAGAFDALLVQFTTNADPSAEVTAEQVIDISARAPIPIFVSRYGAHSVAPRGVERYTSSGVPLLDTPEQAIAAVAALARAGAPPSSA